MSPSSRTVRFAAAACAALFGVSLSAAPANADPKGNTVPLDCGATSFDVAVNGNGVFTPGHITNSTAMLIPTSFGEFHGVLTDEEGNIIDEFTDPAMAKGPGAVAKANVSCTFTIVETFQDPELGPGTFTFTGTGSAEGFLTPRR